MDTQSSEACRLTRMDKSWATLCTLAKLEDFRFHDCRHHFASMLVQRGVDLNMVRELLGHASLEMTLRYSHLRPDNLSAAVAKLGTR
jgi:integrase